MHLTVSSITVENSKNVYDTLHFWQKNVLVLNSKDVSGFICSVIRLQNSHVFT